MNKTNLLYILLISLVLSSCSVFNNVYKAEKYAILETNRGEMVIALYKKTPNHTQNFVNNCQTNIYDSLLFHKVIEGNYILGGDEKSRDTNLKSIRSNEIKDSLFPEINDKLINIRGAVGMWRAPNDMNPEKCSHPTAFYIVDGTLFNEKQLKIMAGKKNLPVVTEYMRRYLNKEENKHIDDSLIYYMQNKMNKEYENLYVKVRTIIEPDILKDHITLIEFSDFQSETYNTHAGSPFLDGTYTVFGQLEHGYDVLRDISKCKTKVHYRPAEPIIILKTKIIEPKEWKELKKLYK